MTYSVSASASQTLLQQNGASFLETDASGNVSLRTGGSVKTLANLQSIGLDQTEVDVTGSRAVGTTYTNSTARPRLVSIYVNLTTNQSTIVTANGIARTLSAPAGTTGSMTVSIVVLVTPGNTYSISAGSIARWTEF